MKDTTNIILIILVVIVIAFAGFVVFNIFSAPQPQTPAILPPQEEAPILKPKPEAKIGPLPAVPVDEPNLKPELPIAQGHQETEAKAVELSRRIKSWIGKIASDDVGESLKAEDELVKIGKPALKELVSALNDLKPGEDILRPEIAFVLGRFEDKEAVSALTGLLDSPNSYIRRNAIEALGKIRSQEAIPALTRKLSDEDALVRESVSYALGEIRDYSATEDLLARVKDENESQGVKLAAIKALAQIKDVRATDELLKQLKSQAESSYKDEIVDSLSDIGDSRAIEELKEYLNSLKNNKPEDSRDSFPWQNSIDITEQAIQKLGGAL